MAERHQSEAAQTDGHERCLNIAARSEPVVRAGHGSLKGAPAPAFPHADREIRRAAPTAAPIVVNFTAFSPAHSAVQ
jgi:hypothetical protein